MTDHCMGDTAGCACHPSTGLYPYGYSFVAANQPHSLYGTSPYGAATGQNCVTLPPSATPLYGSTGSAYDFKDGASAWRSAVYPAGYYTYDAAMPYPYSNGYGAINGAAHTKNATKEATSLLKSWLNDHMQNPYPTKGEKIMLAIITKMTLTQVSTWFANARRRLKKENKMTWSPRNRYDDDDDERHKEDEDEDKSDEGGSPTRNQKEKSLDLSKKSHPVIDERQVEDYKDPTSPLTPETDTGVASPDSVDVVSSAETKTRPFEPANTNEPPRSTERISTSNTLFDNNNAIGSDKLSVLTDYQHLKPRIWSIAETATSESLAARPKHGPVYPFLTRHILPTSLTSSLTSQFVSGSGRQWPWNQGAFRNTSPY